MQHIEITKTNLPDPQLAYEAGSNFGGMWRVAQGPTPHAAVGLLVMIYSHPMKVTIGRKFYTQKAVEAGG